jgi:hypothetical protein
VSTKWHVNKAWEDESLRGPWLPLKWLLRAFSSVTLAIFLLVFIALFGASANVPVGLLALAPTYFIYGLTVLLCVALIALPPAWVIWRTRKEPLSRAVAILVFVVLGVGSVAAWRVVVWPHLRYDPISGEGLRLFAEFVREYRSTTLRRLPGMEMSELEYYAWWPMRVALLLFVANMVIATVRRIDFNFRNIGVLMVHTGIVLIALGSIYYSALKLEGDTILLAGDPGADGRPGIGPPMDRFYDNTRVALYVDQGRGLEQRPLEGVPRYNDYALGAIAGVSARETAGLSRPWESPCEPALDIEAPPSPFGLVDSDIRFRIIGYASYAEPVDDYVRLDEAPSVVSTKDPAGPLRIVYLHTDLPDDQGCVSDKPAYAFLMAPGSPAERISLTDVFAVEYTLGPGGGMSDQRWADLREPLPDGTEHALVVEVPAAGVRIVRPVQEGDVIEAGGYRIDVRQLFSRSPMPIITPGYRGADSSVAVVGITPPGAKSYERYVYHRFPEINQDILGTHADGRPIRRDADASVRVAIIEADRLQVYIDEPSIGRTRAIVRHRFGRLRVIEDEALQHDGWLRNVVEKIHLRIGERWDRAVRVERPAPVPVERRERSAVGTHDKAMLGVEVRAGEVRSVVWVPFTRYMGFSSGAERTVHLPDGRAVVLAFGRVQHRFPNFALQLADFEMLSYDHRGAPRDYKSVIRVLPVDSADFEAYEHSCTLNYPLRAPFMWSDRRPWFTNAVSHFVAGLSPRQFKLSQAGWDAAGWQRTQAQADQGLIPRPYASFTILGVGNNPGIHIIALGGVLMGVGIPWAFYLKPYLVRREKERLRQGAELRLSSGEETRKETVWIVDRSVQPSS